GGVPPSEVGERRRRREPEGVRREHERLYPAVEEVEVEARVHEPVRIRVAGVEAEELRHEDLLVGARLGVRETVGEAPQAERKAAGEDRRERHALAGRCWPSALHERTLAVVLAPAPVRAIPLRLPAREHLQPVDEDDPLRFYYMPVVGRFYRRRLELAATLLDGHGGRVLEVGYGSGVFLPQLAGYGAVVGVDRHREGAAVRAMARREGVEAALVRGEIRRLPFAEGSIDVLVCLSVLEHVAELDEAA